MLPLPIFQLARGEEVQGSEDADAAPSTGGQREEPPIGSFSQSWAFVGKSPCPALHEGENAELQRKVNRHRLIAHHFDDEAEE